jgi:hypothetical protein
VPACQRYPESFDVQPVQKKGVSYLVPFNVIVVCGPFDSRPRPVFTLFLVMFAKKLRSKNKQVDNIDTEVTTIQAPIGGYWILITVERERSGEAAKRSQSEQVKRRRGIQGIKKANPQIGFLSVSVLTVWRTGIAYKQRQLVAWLDVL